MGAKSASRRDHAIESTASRQLFLITAEQLLAAGFTRGGIGKRLQRRRLHALHAGVYAIHPPPYSREQRWLAAVLACGAGSLLSDWPAAEHWRIVPSSVRPVLLPAHVTSPTGRGKTRSGIVVHRRGEIDPRDARVREAIPVTSPELVLVHLAPTTGQAILEQLLVAAESWRGLRRRRLFELVEERRGRPGMRKLSALLELEPALALSDLELLFMPVIRRSGVERPRFNHPISVPGRERPLKVDLAWPELRLAVELDSQRFHGDWESAESDRERDQLLALGGWQTHRFVRRRVRYDPADTARRLRSLVEARRGDLTRRSPADMRTPRS